MRRDSLETLGAKLVSAGLATADALARIRSAAGKEAAAWARRVSAAPHPTAYGIHTFDWAADWAARAKPAAMAANCAHPARMVLGPGGL